MRAFLAICVFLASVGATPSPSEIKPDPRARPQSLSAGQNVRQSQAMHPVGGVPPIMTGGPQILSYSPLFGLPGTQLTIYGRGFGSSQGDSYVSVLSLNSLTYTKWPASSWSDTQIALQVPSGMPLGKVFMIVEVGEQNSPGWKPFTVGIPPQIIDYSPLSGPGETQLTIRGSGFGQSQGTSSVSAQLATTGVRTNWTPATWSDTQIVIPVPSSPGKVYLYVTVGGLDSIGTYPFTVGMPPTITNYTPSFGESGTQLTIQGTGFGQSQGSSSVSFVPPPASDFVINGTAPSGPITTPRMRLARMPVFTNPPTVLTAVSWSDTQIVVTVPAGSPQGLVYLYVTVNGLDATGTYPFTVGKPPTISAYSPLSGGPGTVLTIQGTGFGRRSGGSSVTVASPVTNAVTSWMPTVWTDTEITVPVPAGMPSGLVFLSVAENGFESLSVNPFTVGMPPQIVDYSPFSGPSGTILTINGTGFGATQGSSYVSILSTSYVWTTLTAQSWTDTQVVVSVPNLTPASLSYILVTVDGLRSVGTYPFQVTASQSPK
jgi:hypothetical protein